MATRKAIKAINWSGIAERLGEADKPIFAALKAKSDGYARRMESYPETAPTIDWASYKKSVAVAGLVDKFQKEYESLKVPYPPDNYTSIIDQEAQEAQKAVEKFIEESKKRIKLSEAEIARVKSLLPFEMMTMEDMIEQYPHIWSPEKPTMWPHDPDDQPGDEPEPIPKADH